ncbi:VWA domain-containing protein [Streptomyces laurentii]|uniref:VWA domain-containing protein n=1 Tax=Streptomyces laurentii TaxID=39478 RepID=UPI00369AABA6
MSSTDPTTTRRGRPRGFLLLAAALLALAGPFGAPSATAVAGAAGAAPARAAAAPASEGPDPIDFAVVVDQSKSLSDRDLVRETEAAALLSQGEISERSRATVIGFGSSEKSGQSPVREVCPPTVVDGAGRQRLSDCVTRLARRDSVRTGPGTDFPAAIRQAVARLTEDPGTGGAGAAKTPRVLFLLTDGRLDVRDSPEYGADPGSRQANGAKRLADELARARAAGVQIWPLGFGGGIDRGALTAMAEGGFRGACSDVPGSAPRMRVVSGSAGIDRALQETFAAARCARIVTGDVARPPADLYVTIPPIATDGSLTVGKHDPKVRVTYYDPEGRKVPLHGSFDGSSFEVSGEDGPVEALRVTNPLPGRWRVRVEAPEGHRGQEVAVRALWQGRLRSAVVLDPASPRPGQRTVVEVRLQTRRGVVVADPRQLEGVTVAAHLAGDGFAPVAFRLADDGRAPDRTAGDVRFTGTVTVPATATGDLELTTSMAAPGITSDRRPFHTRIAEGTPPVVAQLSLERVTAHPGGAVPGVLQVANHDTVPHTLRIALADDAPDTDTDTGTGTGTDTDTGTGTGGPIAGSAAPRISPETVVVPPGGSVDARFTVTLGADTPLGALGSRLAVTDTGRPGETLDSAFLDVRVEAPPTWWDRWWPYVTGGAAVLVLLAALTAVQLVARRRRQDLTGVRIELRKEGWVLDTLEVRAGQSPGGEFRFTIEEPAGPAPTLHHAHGARAAHRLRRTGSGALLLRPESGPEIPVHTAVPVEVADAELVIRTPGGFRTRTGPGRTPRGARPGRPPRRPDSAAAQGADGTAAAPSAPPAPAPHPDF